MDDLQRNVPGMLYFSQRVLRNLMICGGIYFPDLLLFRFVVVQNQLTELRVAVVDTTCAVDLSTEHARSISAIWSSLITRNVLFLATRIF